jgi:transglutaminase-like putative cysteine protease
MPLRTVRAVCRSILAVLLAVLALCGEVAFAADAYPLPEVSKSKKTVYSKGGTVIDYGHAAEGYVLVRHEPVAKHLKVRITKGKSSYTYDLNSRGEFEVFPLQMGNGKYKVQLFEEAENEEYIALEKKTISVKLRAASRPFLYPSQYVDYGENTGVAAKSLEVCAGLTTDADKVKAVCKFLRDNMNYHFKRARSVKTGYVPALDDVLAERKGVCFDYAALMACMLRVQAIPAKMVIGYADKMYHAWNEVLVDGKWKTYDTTFAALGVKATLYEPEKYY